MVFQAGLTTLGNGTLALAGWNLLRQQRRLDGLKPASPPAPAAAPEP